VYVSASFWWVCLSIIVAEFREDVRIVIPAVVEHLKDSDWYVRKAAIKLLSRMAVQGTCWHHFLVDVHCAQACL